MISLGAGFAENVTAYFSRSDVVTPSKYNLRAAHHALIRRIVLSSQNSPQRLPVMIFSTASVQCLLYGITTSGSSWCITRQALQRSRLMISVCFEPSPLITPRFLLPITVNAPPHTGHTLTSSLCM